MPSSLRFSCYLKTDCKQLHFLTFPGHLAHIISWLPRHSTLPPLPFLAKGKGPVYDRRNEITIHLKANSLQEFEA